MAVTTTLRFMSLGNAIKIGTGTNQAYGTALTMSETGLVSVAWSIYGAIAVRRFNFTPNNDNLFTIDDLAFTQDKEQIITGAGSYSYEVKLANFANDDLLVYFQSPYSYGTPYGLTQLVDPNGDLVGSTFQPSGAQYDSSLVEVGGKVFFVTGYPVSIPSLYVLSATSTGLSQGPSVNFSNTGRYFSKAAAAALDDGTQLYIWSDNTNSNYQSLWFAKADGSTIVNPLKLLKDLSGGISTSVAFEVAAVEGGFALLFHTTNGEGYNGDLYLQVFNNDASPRTDPILVGDVKNSSQNWNPTTIFEIGDGRIVAVFNNNQYRIFDQAGNKLSNVITDDALSANGSVLPGEGGFFSTTESYNGAFLHARELVREWTGDADDNNIEGSDLRDFMSAGSGNDTLSGGWGDDRLDGGSGDDFLSGGDGDDTLIGGDGDDTLQGGAGANRLEGLAGDDTYIFTGEEGSGGAYVESSGYDTVLSYVSGSLNNNTIEEIRLFDRAVSFSVNADRSASITIKGNVLFASSLQGGAAADKLFGGNGNDTLDGREGADTMSGSAGSDTYIVDNVGDRCVEANGAAGIDTVQASVSYSLGGSELESLILTGGANINGSGNSIANTLTGNSGANVLNGQGGADTMIGGAGSDTYYVDDFGDRAIEANGAVGIDLVYASRSYSLGGSALENLTLTGVGNFNGTGNSLANVLRGNSGANVIDGLGGADTMIGGAGSDTYIVDNAADKAIEANGAAGIDLVKASISFSLGGSELENLTLTGTGNINATGNSIANVLTGNVGANVLNGLGGADTMIGGAGNDTYLIDNTGDRLVEVADAGTDSVQSTVSYTISANVENMLLLGSGNVNATGNAGANTLKGNVGKNVIDGGLGRDALAGNAGQDTFVFSTTLGATNVDRIIDFSATDDTIQLSKGIFTALSAGTLAASAFKDLSMAGAKVDADDRILYDRTTGALSYDADGSGAKAAVQFATIDTKVALTNADFFVV